MLTFMKKDHNFDGEDTKFSKSKEELAKESAEKMKFMSLSDMLTLLVIAALIGGGYYYFKTAKENAAKAFEKCDAVYTSADYLAAEACYDSTWDLGYITDTLEVIRQNRTSQIADLRLAQMDLLQSAQDYVKDGDTVAAKEEMKKLQGQNLLVGKHLEAWKKLEAIEVKTEVAVDSTALQDSSVKQ